MHHCRSLRHKNAVVRLILSRNPSIRVFRGSTIRLLHQPSQQSTSQYTSTSSWHLRSRDGAVIRREILHCIHEQLEASKAEVAVGRHEVQNSRALQLKGCLVNLMTHAEQYLKTEDGELAQKALDAFVLTRTTQGSSSSLVKTDPVLAADLVSLVGLWHASIAMKNSRCIPLSFVLTLSQTFVFNSHRPCKRGAIAKPLEVWVAPKRSCGIY